MSWTRTHRQLAVMADVIIELKHLQYPVGKVVEESYPYGVVYGVMVSAMLVQL